MNCQDKANQGSEPSGRDSSLTSLPEILSFPQDGPSATDEFHGEAAAADGENPWVDWATLRAAAGDDPQFLRELVELYETQAEELIGGLRRAVGTSSARDITHFAHKLVGASVACGVKALVGPLRELETRGRAAQLADLGPLLTRAGEDYEATRRELAHGLGAASPITVPILV